MELTCLVLLLGLQSGLVGAQSEAGLPLVGKEAERFLRTAEIVDVESAGTRGVTQPHKVELSDGHRTCFAVFKTIDDYAMKKEFDDGTFEVHFSDSYRYEIAAYELDKLLGLGMVPPTVERRVRHDVGSLSLWVEGAMTEGDRLADGTLHPPNLAQWNDQIQTLRLFLQLIYDSDYRNINNMLVTPDWKIYKIDSSRAFRHWKKLQPHLELTRFSKRLLAALAGLDREALDDRLGEWLDTRQIDALWARRGILLDLARKQVAERGEEAVLFD
jgi:hypothetical protein